MKELSFADIEMKKSELIKFEIPKWEGVIYIKPMSVKERLDLQEEHFSKGPEKDMNNKDVMLSMLEKSVVNSQGAAIFNKKTVAVLAEKDWAIVSSIFQKCAEVNVLSLEGEKLAKKK